MWSHLDFEDWEGFAQAHNTKFLWPDGSVLNDTAEGYIDDFVVLTPTADLTFQVLYVAITNGTIPPFTAVATLMNP